MPNRTRFSRLALVLMLFLALCAGMFSPHVEQSVEAKPLGVCPGGIITQWTFAGNVTIPSTGVGTFSNGTGVTPTFTTGVPDPAINFSGWGGSIDINDYVELAIDTTLFSDIGVTFNYRATGTGPNTIEIRYSSDGVSFTPYAVMSLSNDSNFNSFSINLGSVTSINNNPNTKIRLYGYGATSGAGTLRFDNVTISELCPPSMEVAINEVAWSGTSADPSHEWIELYNTSGSPIDLTNWKLVSSDGTPNITFLSGSIPIGGYFLLERDENATNVSSDLIYFGALSDSGETLYLYDELNNLIDTANGDGGGWPEGNESTHSTMERALSLPADSDTAWYTNDGTTRNGLDFNEDPIWGTPKSSNAPTPTPTPTNTSTSTSTPTNTSTITPTSSGIRSIIINEIAWAGTASGLADDEWIELYNPSSVPIDITDWVLKSTDGIPNIVLDGIIPAGGYFLLERGSSDTDDSTVLDIDADQIYTGNALANGGEYLQLIDTSNKVVDTANNDGGAWPRGSDTTYGTMERIANTADSNSAWVTNTGSPQNGKNANGGNILGTPRNKNTVGPTPTPGPNRTATPTRTLPPSTVVIDPRPIINEILARPGFDWNQDGKTNVFDEFIEIKNLTATDLSLSGWKLSTVDGDTFTLPAITLKPGERIVFYGEETNILLSDGGETVRLSNSSGKIYDAFTYELARAEDRSFCRLPDGNPGNSWFEDCIPTPNLTNTREGKSPTSPDDAVSPVCNLPDTIPLDFFIPECRGYGANIWNPYYWDQLSGIFKKWITDETSKWDSFIE